MGFFGLFGTETKTNVQQVTETTTEQFDQRAAATEGGVALAQGAQLTLTDPGIVDLTRAYFDASAVALSDAFDFGRETQQRAFDVVAAGGRSEAAGLTSEALRLVVPLALLGVAVWGLPKVIRG